MRRFADGFELDLTYYGCYLAEATIRGSCTRQAGKLIEEQSYRYEPQ